MSSKTNSKLDAIFNLKLCKVSIVLLSFIFFCFVFLCRVRLFIIIGVTIKIYISRILAKNAIFFLLVQRQNPEYHSIWWCWNGWKFNDRCRGDFVLTLDSVVCFIFACFFLFFLISSAMEVSICLSERICMIIERFSLI